MRDASEYFDDIQDVKITKDMLDLAKHIVEQKSGHFEPDKFAALRHRSASFVLDGEAVLLGDDGRSDFNGLHSRRHNEEVQLFAFDLLAADGEDLCQLPLHRRKNALARLLARRIDGVAPFEQGELGPDFFRHDCLMGLEALVTKHKERPYRAGRCDHWIKMTNRKHPAMSRVHDQFA